MARQHWLDSLKSALAREVQDSARKVRDLLADAAPVRTPRRDERIKAFLNTTLPQRQALAARLGPEGYANYLQGIMDDILKLGGPELLRQIQPYIYAEGSIMENLFQERE